MPRPTAAEYAPEHGLYISQTTGETIQELVQNHAAYILDFFARIPAAQAGFAYAPGKWTVQELLQHLIDSERVFVYRAMRFSRRDELPLQPFDENDYVAASHAAGRLWSDMVKEFSLLRQSSDLFFTSLNSEQLACSGVANNLRVSVNALAYITYGHTLHHINVLKERYGLPG